MEENSSRGPFPVRLLICAMGGEGGGVLTGWIVAAARAQGLAVQATSVPGVAQRTGGTTYYVEMASRDPAGHAPIFALTPVPGQVDVVLASELVEGARAAQSGFATPDRTIIISSTHRVFLIQEKMAMADGRLDPVKLEEAVRQRSRRALLLDLDALAAKAGVPISPVLLGALAGAAALPIERRHFEAAIKDSGIAVARNLQAFEAACTAAVKASATPEGKGIAASGLAPADFIIDPSAAARPELAGYPAVVRLIVAHGVDRLEDYQDKAYAALYLKRLEVFRDGDTRVLREVARQLALRMSYEDVIRVAQHKARAERFARIQGEVGADGEPFEVQDFFKPGVREIADVLPPRLARFMLRRAERSQRLAKFHVGMKVKTTTVTDYLRVWMLARLRPWRRGTFRYEAEQAAIEAWLGLVRQAADRGDTALAIEVAELARLIKGYGDTNLRGQITYGRIVEALVLPALGGPESSQAAAPAVRAAREAALSDPEGKGLDAALATVRSASSQPAA